LPYDNVKSLFLIGTISQAACRASSHGMGDAPADHVLRRQLPH
jgi:hypothetical protein